MEVLPESGGCCRRTVLTYSKGGCRPQITSFMDVIGIIIGVIKIIDIIRMTCDTTQSAVFGTFIYFSAFSFLVNVFR